MSIIKEGQFIIPGIVYPGDNLDANDVTRARQADALLSAMESGWAEASYSLTQYSYMCSNEGAVRQYFIRERELWDERRAHFSYIERKYTEANGVHSSYELDWEQKKKLILDQEVFKFNNGQMPQYWVTGLKFFYANRFALAIDQIVLPLSLLKKYPEVIKDHDLYDLQIAELKTISCSKAIRDSMIHREDRLRGLNKFGREISGSPEEVMHMFTKDSDKPASVMIHSGITSNHELMYTDWEGNQVSMPVRIDFFELVESIVQGILENLIYKSYHPRFLRF